MQNTNDSTPSFNLWSQPWISLITLDGKLEQHSIEGTLLNAHEFHSIYEMSPLVFVGIHRLLTAVLQNAFNPQHSSEIIALWNAGQFPRDVLEDFRKQYITRFDLFSAEFPFMQSAEVPLFPGKEEKNRAKSAAYLFAEIPTGTEITHFRHGAQDDQTLCPACCASGLVTASAFAIVGGAGIKPSINGVPPIYILPEGVTLFHSLTASLMLPDFQPSIAEKKNEGAWWQRSFHLEESQEVFEVTYPQSLTFPARYVRLFPEEATSVCSRCGKKSDWIVRQAIYQMGEERPKDSPFWEDPFAAYHKHKEKPPTPVRPLEGKSLWRDFASLFLSNQEYSSRPRVLDQISSIGLNAECDPFPFHCVGLRTDMKAKIFEWVDASFQVPAALLDDPKTAILVVEALDFSQECAFIIKDVFKKHFVKRGSKKKELHKALLKRLEEQYWNALARPFQEYILRIGLPHNKETIQGDWYTFCARTGFNTFMRIITMVGDDAANLRLRVNAERECDNKLNAKWKEINL